MFLLVTLPNIHRFKKNFTHRLSKKPFLIRLLTIPQHIKYVATLPCRPNLSLMACFSDMIVLQGSVATHARSGGILNIYLTANLPRNLPVKFSLKSIKIWQNYGHESVAPLFWSTLYMITTMVSSQTCTTKLSKMKAKILTFEMMYAIMWKVPPPVGNPAPYGF